jgi:hypothetical protein
MQYEFHQPLAMDHRKQLKFQKLHSGTKQNKPRQYYVKNWVFPFVAKGVVLCIHREININENSTIFPSASSETKK